MDTVSLSLTETADRFGISKGYLSQRTQEQQPAKGHHLYRYARVDEKGRIAKFEIPHSKLPNDDSPTPEEANKRPNKHRETAAKEEEGSPQSSSQTGRGQNENGSPPADPTPSDQTFDQTGERLAERENPESLDSITTGIASGVVVEIAKDFVKETLGGADTEQKVTLLHTLKDVARHIAPIAAGAAWAYSHQESDDVSQLAGSLLVAAGTDVVVHGDESIFGRLLPTDSTSEEPSSSALEGGPQTPEGIADELTPGDGVPHEDGSSVGLSLHDSDAHQ